ncbi:MAG: OmpA family protein, partial [Bacteroidota bacterium]
IVQKIGETWQFPQPMAIENYYTTGENVNVTMSPDGEVLLMSLQRKDSYGRNDLYVSFKNQVGGWTEPMNLGPNINSHFSEDTPTISIDKKTIYFSSNRTNSMGGRDIFRSRRNCESWTNWTIPRRFVGPINSNRDDSQPFFNDRTGYLYFTSNRAGSADIYRVQIANPKRDEVLVKGKIIDTQTEQPMAAKLLYGPTDLGHFLRFFRSKNGTFEFRMPKGKNYKVSAEKSNFLATQQIVETRKGTYYPTQEITIYLTPIKENATIKLAPIYFKQSEATILEKSFAALEELLAILQKNSTISIRIEGHTDNQGKPQDLLDLSEARAFAIKRYLMDQGVGSARIQTIGYGGTRPAKANTQRLRAQNRRVEVRIVKL